MKRYFQTFVGSAFVFMCLGCVKLESKDSDQPNAAREIKPQFTLDTKMLDVWGKEKVGPYQMAVSPTGKYLMFIGHSKTANVQVWDLDKKVRLHAFDDENGTMNMPIAVSPDGETGAYVGLRVSEGIAVVSLKEGKKLRVIKDKKDRFSSYCRCLRYSPKGDLLILAVGRDILTFDPKTGNPGPEWQEASKVQALSNFFEDGKKIASINEAGDINIWDTTNGKKVKTLSDGDPDNSYPITFTSDGKTAISHGKKFKFWDVATGKVRREFSEYIGVYPHMVFLPGERTVVWNTSFGFVIYDLETGAKKQEVPKAHEKFVIGLTVKPDGSMLLTASDDSTIKGWALNKEGLVE